VVAGDYACAYCVETGKLALSLKEKVLIHSSGALEESTSIPNQLMLEVIMMIKLFVLLKKRKHVKFCLMQNSALKASAKNRNLERD
jgi:hypothetical protein